MNEKCIENAYSMPGIIFILYNLLHYPNILLNKIFVMKLFFSRRLRPQQLVVVPRILKARYEDLKERAEHPPTVSE